MLFIVAFFFAVCIIVCPTMPIVGKIVAPIVVVGILVIGLFSMGSMVVEYIDYELD